MATIDVFDLQKKKVGQIELSDAVFNAEVKQYLIHEAVKVQLANRRAGTASTKNRSAVSGGGRKPYKQKGTGNARQGSIRAPHYPGGGVAFGPQPKDYNLAMNKKARRAALRSALSLFFKENKLTVVNGFDLPAISTKGFVSVLKDFSLDRTLVVIDGANPSLQLSARNVKDVKVLNSEGLNIYDLLRYQNVVFTQDAVRKVEGVLQP
jgi:large subunit ribosomal protein L4